MIRLLLDRKATDDIVCPRLLGFDWEIGSRTGRDNPLSKKQAIDRGLTIGIRVDRLTSIRAVGSTTAFAVESRTPFAISGERYLAQPIGAA
jgi:hypothetical protein